MIYDPNETAYLHIAQVEEEMERRRRKNYWVLVAMFMPFAITAVLVILALMELGTCG